MSPKRLNNRQQARSEAQYKLSGAAGAKLIDLYGCSCPILMLKILFANESIETHLQRPPKALFITVRCLAGP
ncbi:hypothetical protein ACJJH9_04445 [Microbulbifer sp. DLAB2-AF]|uniref:hypothetical protein n=1 Tax=Microbulbifer sp. DLAB2-AF TaxID=3243395 RepID=UPI004039B4E4